MNRTLITIICFALALGLGLGLLWPKYQFLQSLQAQIKEEEEELQTKTEYFSQIKKILEELKKYEEELSKISNALPTDPSLPSLFNFLQKAASQTGLVLESIALKSISAPEAQKEPTKIKEIDVDLSLAGPYPALKDFLSAIEKSARIIEVRKISFSSPEDPSKPFSFEILIKTHSY